VYYQHYLKLSYRVGYVERILYTWSILLGFPQFVVVWLSLKALGGWGGWSNAEQLSRARFIVTLIGNGLSLLVAVGFALLTRYAIDLL